MAKIMLLATGGTISGSSSSRLDFKDYKTGSLSGQDFLERLPEISEIADVEVEQLTNFSSTQISFQNWKVLKQKVEYYLNEKEYDGIVITHGTNTLEETAYFLHLTVNSDKPVVIVGAQRPFSALGSDSAINLLNAIRVAKAPESRGKGVLVILNDEINSAREVTKTNTYRLETFQSGQIGFLGYVDPDGTVQYYRSPIRKHTINSYFSTLSLKNVPEVAIVYSYAGVNNDIIEYLTKSSRYRGIVIAGTGAGKFSRVEEEALAEAAKKGISIVRSSRVGNGRVVDLECYKDFSFTSGDNLLPQKARILLMLSLLAEFNNEEIQNAFNNY